MKKDMLIGSGIGIVVGVVLTLLFSFISKQSGPGTASVSLELPKISKLDENYLVKIEDFGISVSDFTNAYDQFKQNLPPEQLAQIAQNESVVKADILETMINQYAVVATAIEEGFLEDGENMRLFKNAAQQALFQLYMTKNMPEDGNQFKASQPEIDQAYAQFGNELRARGLNAQQSRDFIVNQISQQKRQRWLLEFVSKIKEGFRVERNNEALKSNDISTSSLPAVTPQ